jgi:hypothetical protein
MKRASRILIAIAGLAIAGGVVGEGPMLVGEHTAHAIVGRPLTPMSYAGVARRTTRRAAYAGAYGGYGYGYGGYAAPGAYAAGAAAGAAAATVATLPAGCAMAGGVYNCGAVQYRPYYQGTTVVYQPV